MIKKQIQLQKLEYLYLQRNDELKSEIKKNFKKIKNNYMVIFPNYGSSNYDLMLDKYKYLDYLLNINKNKNIYIIDIGAGDGSYLNSMFLYINNKKIKDNTIFYFLSLTGEIDGTLLNLDSEKYIEKYIKIGYNCYHIFLTSFYIEYLIDEIKNIKLEDDIIQYDYRDEFDRISFSLKDLQNIIIYGFTNDVSLIVSYRCFMHVTDPIGLLDQCYIILKNNGIIELDIILACFEKNKDLKDYDFFIISQLYMLFLLFSSGVNFAYCPKKIVPNEGTTLYQYQRINDGIILIEKNIEKLNFSNFVIYNEIKYMNNATIKIEYEMKDVVYKFITKISKEDNNKLIDYFVDCYKNITNKKMYFITNDFFSFVKKYEENIKNNNYYFIDYKTNEIIETGSPTLPRRIKPSPNLPRRIKPPPPTEPLPPPTEPLPPPTEPLPPSTEPLPPSTLPRRIKPPSKLLPRRIKPTV